MADFKIEEVQYTTQYNVHFRPISNEQIFTVEISPTGSGKTHFYKDFPNTIMIMPTNALVRQNCGLISDKKAKGGERTDWEQLHKEKCDYMTYDKLYGHIKSQRDISDMNIIIDEAHLILSSESETHYELLNILFNRKVQYKELKLISATIRPEVLAIFYENGYELDIIRYTKSNQLNKVIFTKTVPVVDDKKKTLFFINSKDKILQLIQYYVEKYPQISTKIINADDELDIDDDLGEYDIIFATSAIKQGYSIDTKVDQVVIHNIYHSVGAIDILQYMARPRNQQPDVYVVSASTHFTKDVKNMNIPNIDKLISYVHQHEGSDEEYRVNAAIEVNKFIAKTKFSNQSWNILALINYYEYLFKNYELYGINGDNMKESLVSMLPSIQVEFLDVEPSETIKFKHLDKKQLLKTLRECATLEDLKTEITTQIEIYEQDSNSRDLNFLKQLENITPIQEFTMEDPKDGFKVYEFKNSIIVEQVLDTNTRKLCEQHIDNIKNGVYEIRDKHDSRYLPKVGEIYTVGKISRKISFLQHKFKGKTNPIDILKKVYGVNLLNDKGKTLSINSNNCTSVKITSKYTVQDDWYSEVKNDTLPFGGKLNFKIDYSDI